MIRLSEYQESLVRFTARLSAIAACSIFTWLSVSQGPPVSPEGPGIERDIQYVLVAVGIFATLLAWFKPLPGGWLLVVTGGFLGMAAAGRYTVDTSFFVALIFVLPGLLFILVGVSGRGLVLQALYALAVVVVMTYGGLRAEERHEYAFGPAHPQSDLVAQPHDRVEWVWSGAVTPTAFSVNARLAPGVTSARLVVSESPSLSAPVYSGTVAAGDQRVVSLRVDGLRQDTAYYYAVEAGGEIDGLRRGSLRTFPAGRASFSIAVAACARTGSNGAVFGAIRGEDALFYLVTGDIQYENITRNDLGRFQEAYQTLVTSPAQQALYQETPIAYIWDDHDFGGSNSNATAAAKPAARLSYRLNVPHYDLPAGDGNAAIYQAFSAGRVRFVLLDTRSMRDAEKLPDGGTSLLGREQRDWLKQELLTSARSHALVVLVSGVPWIAPAAAAGDDWGGFAEERAQIADFIADNGIDNLLLLAGDAHMLAIDDGSNSDYSARGGAGFPVMQAGALDRPGSVKGGPYSEGTYPGAGHYGLVTFTDDGASISVQLSGRNWLGEEIVAYGFTVPLGQVRP
jgi:phosphodiesterase/alkaline phosphatase D-like protein